jgi:hypothetical protein
VSAQVTLSENVQRVVELSQRIVVEKSVINQYEQVQNHLKTSEISIENSKRVVLSDNNSSSTSTVIEKSNEKLTESNGMVQNCERFSGKECTVENNMKADDETTDNNPVKPKSSSSCNDLLIFCQSQPKVAKPEMEQTTASVADFTIPYNIINNYFSGLYIRARKKPLQKEIFFVRFSFLFTIRNEKCADLY